MISKIALKTPKHNEWKVFSKEFDIGGLITEKFIGEVVQENSVIIIPLKSQIFEVLYRPELDKPPFFSFWKSPSPDQIKDWTNENFDYNGRIETALKEYRIQCLGLISHQWEIESESHETVQDNLS